MVFVLMFLRKIKKYVIEWISRREYAKKINTIYSIKMA